MEGRYTETRLQIVVGCKLSVQMLKENVGNWFTNSIIEQIITYHQEFLSV